MHSHLDIWKAWLMLYHARVHITATAPIEALRILWVAQEAVTQNRGIRLEDVKWNETSQPESCY